MNTAHPLRSARLFALLSVVALSTSPALAAGDPVAGKKSFIQCQMCHTAETGGANRIGPNLAGIVGSKAASKPGFAYSPALKKTGWTWNAKTLDTFIKKPAAAVPGTKMVYAGLADDTARANVIAYLTTLKAK